MNRAFRMPTVATVFGQLRTVLDDNAGRDAAGPQHVN